MYRFSLLVFIILTGLQPVTGQEKRALIIGIDKYTPPKGTKIPGTARSEFRDLDGCVNDGRAMHSVLLSRFQFPATNMDTAFNQQAGREAILKKINDLLAKTNSGDVVVLFYAGHGSQVNNSLSRETDKKDESIVPADTWKPGVADIRDKELTKIYNAFLDKGANLTVILDCCHSGSLARGPQVPGKFRFIADAAYDAKDESQPTPPETRTEGKFLILSAAQDNEFAQEQRDANNVAHGAFTIALLQALDQQSVNASAINLFSSIRAILKSNGKKQEPVLGAQPGRQQQTLFGLAKGTVPDKSLVAVSGFERDKVLLQGGFALGLYKENELVKCKGTDTLVKLVIDTIYSVNRSLARVIKGKSKDLTAGDLLEVTNWVSSGAPLLKIYLPPNAMTFTEIGRLAAVNKELRASGKINWINELEKKDPYTSVFHDGKKFRINTDGKEVPAPATLTAASLMNIAGKDSSFYFELPLFKELYQTVKARLQSPQNKSIVITDNMADAQYTLYGTIDEDGNPAYGLRRTQTAARDSLESMPVQTKSFTVTGTQASALQELTESIYEYAMRLSKIRGWLQLTGPDESENSFPFHLEMRDKTTGDTIKNNEYKVGHSVAFHLVANPGSTSANKIKRYVYVFLIDKAGNMTLTYPDANDGNLANQFPKFRDYALVNDVFLFEGTVSEPVGTDNYFLLASDEPIPNFSMVFNQDGVRGIEKGNGHSLGNLLNMGNEGGTRGFTKSVANWNLIKLAVKSRY